MGFFMGQTGRVQEGSAVYTTHPSLAACGCPLCVCVCALLGVGDIFLLRNSFVLSRGLVSVSVCDKPPAWGLLSSPSFPSYISSGGTSQAWATGSPCWRPLELTVWEEQLEKAAFPPGFHPN